MRARHGTEQLFANAAHIATATENPVTETTERESTVPEPRFPVGTDMYPIDGAKLVDLPIGSVLTIRSRNRGELRGGAIHFGCQSWTLDQLRQARATVEFQPNGGVVVTADVTVIDRGNGLLVAGQRQGLGDVNEYAASIIVKEVAVVQPDNAVVMEHGFYGCAQHPDHVIIVGMGHASNRGPARPLVGMIRKAGGGPELTGTVGVTEGLRHPSMSECTPVWGSTTAHTMNFASERRYSLVPCTPEQIERMQPPGGGAHRGQRGRGVRQRRAGRHGRAEPVLMDAARPHSRRPVRRDAHLPLLPTCDRQQGG